MGNHTGPNQRLLVVRFVSFALGVALIVAALIAFAGGNDGQAPYALRPDETQAPRADEIQAPPREDGVEAPRALDVQAPRQQNV